VVVREVLGRRKREHRSDAVVDAVAVLAFTSARFAVAAVADLTGDAAWSGIAGLVGVRLVANALEAGAALGRRLPRHDVVVRRGRSSASVDASLFKATL
jgi:hypothetical protein